MKESDNLVGKRISEIRGPLSYRELSEDIQSKTGVYISHSSLQKYVSGEREAPKSKLEILANYCQKPLYWFYLEDGQEPDFSSVKEETASVSQIPILGVIRAGEPIYAAENIIGYRTVETERIKNGEYFYLLVKGDSMLGSRIMEGDLVLVRCQEEVENGEIAAVIMEREEATLKRVYRTNGQLILQPDNPKYKPLVFNKGDVRILGKVVEVVFKP